VAREVFGLVFFIDLGHGGGGDHWMLENWCLSLEFLLGVVGAEEERGREGGKSGTGKCE
jgi:hypothetical protein